MTSSFQPIPIEHLHRRCDARPLNDEALADLEESIAAVGLVNPIRVRQIGDGDEYGIIAGSHRFAACDALGWHEIPCILVDDNDVRAEMAMIAENLHRAELTALQRDEQVARWMVLSGQREEASEPIEHKASEVLPQPVSKPIGGRPEGGVRDASRDLGINREDARRAVKVASLSPEAKESARQLGVDDNRTALLAAAKHKTPETQVQALQQRQQGGIAGRVQPKEPAKTKPPSDAELYERFSNIAEPLLHVNVAAIVAGAGKNRVKLAQLAGAVRDQMEKLIEQVTR